VVETQAEMLRLLARAPDVEALVELLPEVEALVRRRLSELKRGRIPLEKLIVRQQLSRTLEEYRSPSPAARALLQLQPLGKSLRPGQSVRLVYTRGRPGVYAWDQPERPDPRSVDLQAYQELLLRAAGTILEPFGVTARSLNEWVLDRACSLPLACFPP
jgi:DNA polymerase elongation subunit (family B)